MSVVTENYTIDLGDDSKLSLTKRIYDVQEPDKRQSHFTKTITVPSSKTNDLVFQGMFDVNLYLDSDTQFDPWFNPSKKANCILHTDTSEQMSGYAQLTDIVLNRYTNKVEYKLTLYGEVRDLFAELTNKKLNELDLSKYDHLYTKANIESSWGYEVYVNDVLTSYAEGGNGYVYPQVHYGDDHRLVISGILFSTDYWKVEHFRPWIYVKTIVDAIFQSSGFSYYSNFFDSSMFKKLIYQGDINGLKKSDDEIDALSIQAAVTAITDYPNITDNNTALYSYVNYPIIFDSETTDPAGQYNPANGITIIDTSDIYNIVGRFSMRLTNSSGLALDGKAAVLIQGIKSTGDIFFSNTINVVLDSQTLGGWTNGSTKDFTGAINETIGLTAADTFKIVVRSIDHEPLPGGAGTNGLIALRIYATGNTYTLRPQAATTVGTTVSMNNLLDSEMTQKDFLMNIVKMFNLYIEPYWFRVGDVNSGNYNQYLIEPRDDYFTEDEIDWTANLDTNKDFIIKPAVLADSKFFHWTYLNDNDYLNQFYTGQTGRIYGDYIREIDNDFAKGTKKIEIGFSQCIVTDKPFSNCSRLMPVNMNSLGGVRVDGKPKILFYNGTIATSQWRFETSDMLNYPLAHQLDDVFEPTTDLSFQVTPIIYYNGNSSGEIILTNGTLFNKYYYRQILETTDKNSKMIECYMRLRPSDIHNLSFRPLYFIKDAYYRLYEVIDHNYIDTTLCRFLKINEVTPISNTTTTTSGGRGIILGTSEKVPTKAGVPTDSIDLGDFGSLPPPQNGGPVLGTGIADKNYNANIAASNVLTGGNFKGDVIKDNTIVLGFNNMNIASGSTTLSGMEGSPLFIIGNTSAGDINIYLPLETDYNGNLYWILKEGALNNIFVYDSTDALVDTLTGDNESHQILLTLNGVKIITQ